ncbi:MAG: tetratricopeptide repeat protein, partial [candidate division KSB1 bacterium]|nr:tetratricopeptide repeat protein [candidate division KSB1 bacterium]
RFALTGLGRLHGILKGRQDTSGLSVFTPARRDANYLVVEGQVGVRYLFGGRSRAQTPDENLFSEEGGMSPFDAENQKDPAFDDDTQTDSFGAGSGRAESGRVAGDEQLDMEEYVRLKSLADELTQGIELKEREISSLQETLADRQSRLQALQSGSLASANGNFAADRGAPPMSRATAAPLKGSSASFSLAYEQGLSLLTAKRYQEAIDIFATLAARFPNHALVSHCHYWSGEAYFNLGSYQAAVESFNQVLRASLSLKKDNALLMLGRSYLQLNRTEEARRVFNQLIREYPSSEFVGAAEEMLAKL